MYRTRCIQWGAFLVPLALASTASAYVHEKTSTGQILHWDPSSFPIHYLLQTNPPNSSMNADVVKSQFQEWEAAPCAQFSVDPNPGSITQAQGKAAFDQKSEIYWENNWTAGSAVLGLTTPWYDDSTGVISEADMQFNNQDWTWWPPGAYEMCESSNNGCSDTASISLHEEGHFLGLGHSTQQSAVMYASWDGTPKRQLTMDDINGICSIYPRLTPGGMMGVQGQPCTMTSDCKSGLICGAAAGSSVTACTTSCTGANDLSCPAGDACQMSSSGQFGCFPSQGSSGGSQGQPCDQTHGCASGYWCLCFAPAGQQTCNTYTCYQDCDPNNDQCVGNLQCNSWSTVGGAPSGQTTLGGYCNGMAAPPPSANECATCDDTTPCASGLECVPLNDGSGTAVCRSLCTSNSQCSATNTCLPTSSFMTRRGVCACGEDVGAEGGPCKPDMTCNAGQVCVNDGSSTTPLCRTQCGGTLPACHVGFHCQQIGGVSACVLGKPTSADGGTPGSSSTQPGGCQSTGTTLGIVALAGLMALARRRRPSL